MTANNARPPAASAAATHNAVSNRAPSSERLSTRKGLGLDAPNRGRPSSLRRPGQGDWPGSKRGGPGTEVPDPPLLFASRIRTNPSTRTRCATVKFVLTHHRRVAKCFPWPSTHCSALRSQSSLSAKTWHSGRQPGVNNFVEQGNQEEDVIGANTSSVFTIEVNLLAKYCLLYIQRA